MYADNVDANNYNVSIDGYSMIIHELTPNEAYNRRETVRQDIIGGTQNVFRGKYLPRDYTFTALLLIDPLHPDVYDDTFRLWQSKSCEVISKLMGGKFNAEVIVKKHQNDSPNYLSVEIQVIEIPDEKSLIPNDSLPTPTDKITPVKVTSKGKTKDKKNKKKTKKENKKKKGKSKRDKNKKKKGNKITKTKKND